jgi:hypothetical protein
MPYTVWSHDRLLGETDLGFVRCMPKSRTGWFHPTPEGEKLMPFATGVPAALYAWGLQYRHRADATGSSKRGIMDRSTESADLEAAMQHAESLELELRRDDGTVVPTDDIGIRDMDELMVRFGPDADETDVEDLFLDTSESDAELEESVRHDAELILEGFAENDSYRQWSPADLEATKFPRYQIQVALLDDDAIP